ncbi:hypothetical protein [Luteibacter sp. ME-Dv--P-043b]|jgi:outer membrane murein-binding lipoprotein Lpp|uniref:hypothetical protein n=1 Tax=unclassified Luteibacter TaxID=2620188 RepID=UPI0025526D67|nr:hypothetical protein [Luteibacter sp. ME-Dv--P-043b]
MKYVLAIAACVVLAGCATSGMTDTLPKLSSKTSKSVTAYVQCVEPKWQALAKDAKGNAKDDEGRVTANADGKHERLDVTANGSGAQVVMYEIQKAKSGDYDSRFRDEAIACLGDSSSPASVSPAPAPTPAAAPSTPLSPSTPPSMPSPTPSSTP